MSQSMNEMSQSMNESTPAFTSPISHCKFLPTRQRTLTVYRESDESFGCGSDVLQAICHLLRITAPAEISARAKNPKKVSKQIFAKNITFRDREYRVIWTNTSPIVEFYQMWDGQGYLFNVKNGVVL